MLDWRTCYCSLYGVFARNVDDMSSLDLWHVRTGIAPRLGASENLVYRINSSIYCSPELVSIYHQRSVGIDFIMCLTVMRVLFEYGSLPHGNVLTLVTFQKGILQGQ